jgi:hypothetical protein
MLAMSHGWAENLKFIFKDWGLLMATQAGGGFQSGFIELYPREFDLASLL